MLHATILLTALVAASCSSGSDKGATRQSTTTRGAASTTTTQPRPAGPAADMSHEIVGGNGVFIAEATPTNLKQLGYLQHDYVAAGTATDGRGGHVGGAR
jgi:hypothetical protein